jgi:hypothetical protein
MLFSSYDVVICIWIVYDDVIRILVVFLRCCHSCFDQNRFLSFRKKRWGRWNWWKSILKKVKMIFLLFKRPSKHQIFINKSLSVSEYRLRCPRTCKWGDEKWGLTWGPSTEENSIALMRKIPTKKLINTCESTNIKIGKM